MIRTPRKIENSSNEEECGVCWQGGALLGCNRCPAAYHPLCAGYRATASPKSIPPIRALLEFAALDTCSCSSSLVPHLSRTDSSVFHQLTNMGTQASQYLLHLELQRSVRQGAQLCDAVVTPM